jgi:transposase
VLPASVSFLRRNDREMQNNNANRATLAVARKIVAYLVAVDRRQKDFLVIENEARTAA